MPNVSIMSTMSFMRKLLLPALANPQIITNTKNTKHKRTHNQYNDTKNKQTNNTHTNKQLHISAHTKTCDKQKKHNQTKIRKQHIKHTE
jgi:hypothetical protein